eukprot:7650378-Heterocapsa_arctica.AAC.1
MPPEARASANSVYCNHQQRPRSRVVAQVVALVHLGPHRTPSRRRVDRPELDPLTELHHHLLPRSATAPLLGTHAVGAQTRP